MRPPETSLDERGAALLQRVREVYALPPVVAEIQRLFHDPETSARDVARVICRDPAMAAKLLKLVNSAYFGFARKIASVSMAVVILGFRQVRDMVLTIALFERFSPRRSGPFDVVAFWKHSIAAALLAEGIARNRDVRARDAGFTAGLLHDLGKIVATQEAPHLVEEIAERITGGQEPLEAERAVLGLDHAALGAYLAEVWGFPERLARAFRGHHDPARGAEPLVATVQAADALIRSIGIGVLPEDGVPRLGDAATEALRIDDDWLDRAFSQLDRAVDGAEEFLRVVCS